MLKRQSISFKDRIALFAKEVSETASQMPSGPERENMLRKARQAETAAEIEEMLSSPLMLRRG